MNEAIRPLTDVGPNGGRPPTDMDDRGMPLLQTSLFDAIKLGFAVGLAWAVMFLFISLIAWLLGRGSVLAFFEAIYPGFVATPTPVATAIGSIILGFAWSFLYGLIFGFIIGAVYNQLVKNSVFGQESFETYA